MFAEVLKLKKKKRLQRKIFHTPPPPLQENNGPSLMANSNVKKIITTYLASIGQLFDTIIVATTNENL